MEAKTKKSKLTRAAIIDAALDIAKAQGLAAVSMRGVAQRLQISKSGVFSRSGSTESLQMAVIEEYNRRFMAEIFIPAMQQPRGLPRMEAVFFRWIDKIASSDTVAESLHEAVAFSLTTEEDALMPALRLQIKDWMAMTRRTLVQAVQEGHLSPDADQDALHFELHSLMLGTLYYCTVLGDKKAALRSKRCYTRLIDRYRAEPKSAQDRVDVSAAAPWVA